MGFFWIFFFLIRFISCASYSTSSSSSSVVFLLHHSPHNVSKADQWFWSVYLPKHTFFLFPSHPVFSISNFLTLFGNYKALSLVQTGHCSIERGEGGGQYFFLFFLFFCLKFHVSLYSSISYYRQGHEMTYSQSSSVFWSLSESIFLSITVRLAEQTHLSFQQMLRFTMTTRETARCNPARSLFFYFLSVAAALSVMSSL